MLHVPDRMSENAISDLAASGLQTVGSGHREQQDLSEHAKMNLCIKMQCFEGQLWVVWGKTFGLLHSLCTSVPPVIKPGKC